MEEHHLSLSLNSLRTVRCIYISLHHLFIFSSCIISLSLTRPRSLINLIVLLSSARALQPLGPLKMENSLFPTLSWLTQTIFLSKCATAFLPIVAFQHSLLTLHGVKLEEAQKSRTEKKQLVSTLRGHFVCLHNECTFPSSSFFSFEAISFVEFQLYIQFQYFIHLWAFSHFSICLIFPSHLQPQALFMCAHRHEFSNFLTS